uniref:Uncharacterized protein n=1 Tax=Arundo donax TaxID=35708 RepID=A0A0A9CFX8_ARUDO
MPLLVLAICNNCIYHTTTYQVRYPQFYRI